jgi:hypothetical protein
MDPKIQAALIGAFSALVGVIVGGFIQVHLKDRELRKEKRVAEGATTLYLCRLRSLFEEFSSKEVAYKNLDLGICPNDNNMSEVEMVIDLIKSHDPLILVKLFDVKQRLHNIRSYSKTYHQTNKGSGSYKEYDPIVGSINIDAKGGLKDIDLCIRHAFNHSEDETKKYLLKNEEFKFFLPKIVGANWFQRLRINLNFVEKL